MDEQQFQQLLDTLKNAFEKMGMTGAFGDFAEHLDKSNKTMTKQQQLVKYVNQQFDKLNKDLEKGRKSVLSLGPTIKDLGDQIEDLTDDAQKLDLEKRREALTSQYLTAQYKKSAKDLSMAIGDTLIKGIFKGTKTLVNDLQNNSSGIGLASDLMIQAVESSQAGLTAVAKTGQALGGSMASLGGKTGKWGVALSAGSTALEYFTAGVSEAAKAGIEMLRAEVEKTVKAFNDSTSAGALFANGVDGLRDAASKSGLTIEQFGNVIKNNSNDLARAGYTVTEGAKIVGNVTSRFAVQTGKSGQTLQREMLNLGIGFEEQANITARVVSDLKRTGGTATNGQVAQATTDIAKNMKAVADIMGDEAKSRQDAAKKVAEQYAFQAKINELAKKNNDPGLPARVEESMKLMSDSNRTAAMQALVLGGAVTDVAANLTGAADAGRQWAQDVQKTRPTLAELSESTGRLNDKFQSGTNPMFEAISRSTIANGANADITQAINQQQQDSYKANSKNINKAIEDADKLSGAHGGLQKDVMSAEIAAQDLKKALQNELTPAIKKFATVANQILDGVKKSMNAAGIGSGNSVVQKLENNKAISKSLYGAGIGLEVAGAAADVTGIGAIAGIPMGLLGVGAGALGFGADMLGFADGGISTGPVSGHQELLHGTEAVVPLPDGKNIPVEVTKSSSGAPAMDSKLMADMLDALKHGNRMTVEAMQELVKTTKTSAHHLSQIALNTN
jgi:predicted  nucleic acid-binding Zn-ribbon protein